MADLKKTLSNESDRIRKIGAGRKETSEGINEAFLEVI